MMTSRSLVSLWDMLQLDTDQFLRLLRNLHFMEGAFSAEYPNQPLKSYFTIDDGLRKEAVELTDLLLELNLPLSHIEAKRFTEFATVGNRVEIADAAMKMRVLSDRVRDEFKTRHLLVLNETECARFSDDNPFGDVVKKKFPSANFELDEASKCMATGRYTAAVFHWMRTVELGLRAVNSCLGATAIVPGTGRSWGNIIRDLRQLRKGSPPKWPENAYFSSVIGQLEAVKHAWRDDTMHIEQKYTEAEAEAIRIAVQALMQTISSRMNQKGRPLA